MKEQRKKYFFLGSRFLSALADQIILFATPLVVYKLTQSLAFSGAAFAIEWLPRIAALVFSGFLVDKIGARAVYLASDLARALVTLGIFFTLNTSSVHGVYILAVLAGVVGFFSEVAFVALEGSVPKLFNKSEITRAQSILQAIDQTGQLVGPAAATLLVAFMSINNLFLIVSVIFALSLINTFFFLPRAKSQVNAVTHFRRDFMEGFLHVLKTRELLLISFFTVLVNLIVGVTLSVSGGYIQKAFAATPSHFGFMNTAAGIAGLCLFGAFAKFGAQIPIHKVGFFSLLLASVAGLGLGVAPFFSLYALAFITVLIADGFVNIFIRTLRVQYIPEHKMGMVLSILILLNFSAFPLAGLLVSLCAESIGIGWLFVVLSCLVGVVGTVVLHVLKKNQEILKEL